jgi:NAD-reducing hydrogenase small subunit
MTDGETEESRRRRWRDASAATCPCWTSTTESSKLVELVDFDKSPIDDIKDFTQRCAVGPDRRAAAATRRTSPSCADFREHCDILISIGDCAVHGRHPALRNQVPLEECLREAYLDGPSVHNPSGKIPDSPELPLLLDKVVPCHEVVKIDYHLPGCPPPADTLWAALSALLTDKPVELPYELMKYD